MSVYQISFFLISIILISIGNQKELNTFSNYDIIKQKKVDVHFTVNFDKKIVDGKETIFFEALDDREVIILDTKSLEIKNIKVGEENLNYQLDTYSKLESHGVPLKIYKEFTKGDKFNITITYSTKPESMAIDWLDKEQTSGKNHPFMYTQCQAVLCRELLPIQDTPAVKMPVTISITVPNDLLGLAAGILVQTTNDGNDKTYTYETPLPIPSYLIAIAAGDISSKNVSERCTIYAESAKIDVDKVHDQLEKTVNARNEYIQSDEFTDFIQAVLTQQDETDKEWFAFDPACDDLRALFKELLSDNYDEINHEVLIEYNESEDPEGEDSIDGSDQGESRDDIIADYDTISFI